jgi:hypothetical protein
VGRISAQKRNGTVVSYSLYLGVGGEGRKQRRFFRHRSDAEKFLAERNQISLPVGELWERRTRILYDPDQLRHLPTTLTHVVTFYLANGVRRETPRLSEVVEKFLSEKQRIGRSRSYDQAMRYRRQREKFLKKIRPVIDEIKSTGVSTLTGIADCLNRRGIPTRTGKSVWFPSTVKNVVS